MDALMPLACLPVQISGRNRLWRKMTIDAIRSDPAWEDGEYKAQPEAGLRTAIDFLIMAGTTPLVAQKGYPTRDAADAYLADYTARELKTLDANDFLYQVDASRNYDPSAKLGMIKAPVMWVNSADDFINPPELGIAEVRVKEIPHGTFVLIPTSDQTHGHGTHTWAAVWKDKLQALLKETEPK
jgi:homoserine O-acetyltransferase